ncbi:hypothetical protein PLESTB_000780400 [Pleodorina starrii]|uniref:Uncharacterized protein n=1 Tax=Pleodorina starrii TaxID=330485 RepID=A0A9W6BKU5_9CHLO|nr:hypothetical protein PLESTM_000504500 [Pleodorina starrii]GLC53723.1 hypothetical protein PLESTB_000780400 [Pleodorina starrii]
MEKDSGLRSPLLTPEDRTAAEAEPAAAPSGTLSSTHHQNTPSDIETGPATPAAHQLEQQQLGLPSATGSGSSKDPSVRCTGDLDQCFQVRLPDHLYVEGFHPEWVTVHMPRSSSSSSSSSGGGGGGDGDGDGSPPQRLQPVSELRCVNMREVKLGEYDGSVRLGGRLMLSGRDAAVAVEGRRKSEAVVACNIPIGCEDIISLFFTIVADPLNGLAALLVSSIVWLFIVVCLYWFIATKRDDAVLYEGPLEEWILVGVLLGLQGIPCLLDSAFTPWGQLSDLWAFSSKVQPRLRTKMRWALAFITLDQLQPAVLIAFSLYIVLFLSSGELLSAFQNVVVLAFVATLDTAVLKWFLQTRYGSGDEHRISIAFLDIQPYGFGGPYQPEAWNLGAILTTLRSAGGGEVSTERKWRVLLNGDDGLGMLSERYSRTDSRMVVAAVLNVSVVCFSETAYKCVGERLPEGSRVEPHECQAEWYLAGASDAQWTNDLDQANRVALLKHFYNKVKRFPLRETDWSRQDLNARHVAVLAKMLEHSAGVRRLKISWNPRIGDEGVGYLARALQHNTKLTGLWMQGVGMTGRGARAVLEALRKNPRAARKILALGEADAREGLRAVVGEIEASRPEGTVLVCPI